jgi:hypothetical protein
LVGLAHREKSHPPSTKTPVHDGEIRGVDVVVRRLTLASEQVCLVGQVLVALPKLVDSLLQDPALGSLDVGSGSESGADQDADDQREEDGRQRGDVVAEVEHDR